MSRDSQPSGGTAMWALAALVVVACGAGDRDAASAEVEVVEIHGSVFSDFRLDQPCSTFRDERGRPEELSGIVLIFTDGNGRSAVGTATTGVLEGENLDSGCRFLARYRLLAPGADVYRVEFDPPEPRVFAGRYFNGANLLEPQETTLSDLEQNDMRWDFEVPSEWVVP